MWCRISQSKDHGKLGKCEEVDASTTPVVAGVNDVGITRTVSEGPSTRVAFTMWEDEIIFE